MASLPSVSPFLISMMMLLISCCEAREYLVGDSEDSWKVPLPSPDYLNQWANSHQFMISDALIFNYDNETESVHVVNETDYTMCNTVGKHKVFKDGNSKVLLRSSEPIHIISGDKGHCLMGLKLAVVVAHSPAPAPLSSPWPSPSTSHGVVGSSSEGFIRVMTILGISFMLMKVFFIV